MVEPRFILETPCEHGAAEAICVYNNLGCRGGGRRLINIDYQAAADELNADLAEYNAEWHGTGIIRRIRCVGMTDTNCGLSWLAVIASVVYRVMHPWKR